MRGPQQTPTLSSPPSFSTRLNSWMGVLRQKLPRPARDRIICLLFPGAHGKHWPSTRWLRTYSAFTRSNHDIVFSTLWYSNTQARKIRGKITHLASLIYLTTRFLPTCISPTYIHKFHGNSSTFRRNYFHAWCPRCTGIRAIRNYTGCAPTETVLEVGQLMLQPVGQP